MRGWGWWLVAACCASPLIGARPLLAAEDVTATSSVPGISITPLSELPRAPGRAGDAALCGHRAAKPVSPGAAVAASLGWSVTGELSLGELSVVSFVGGFTPGTSGSCLLTEGNVGFFAGARLVAVAYAPSSSSVTLGRIEPLGDGGARIWDGDYLPQPVADVRVNDNGAIAIVPLAAEDSFCQGRAIVPNLYGLPMGEAWRRLAGQGWRPEGPAAGNPPGLQDCSGTGFGFCSFEYRSAVAALSVVTAGEGRAVASYSVACQGAPAR